MYFLFTALYPLRLFCQQGSGKYDVSLTAAFYYRQAVALGQRLFIFWHTKGRKLAACIFDFYYTTLAAGEKRNGYDWMRLVM